MNARPVASTLREQLLDRFPQSLVARESCIDWHNSPERLGKWSEIVDMDLLEPIPENDIHDSIVKFYLYHSLSVRKVSDLMLLEVDGRENDFRMIVVSLTGYVLQISVGPTRC